MLEHNVLMASVLNLIVQSGVGWGRVDITLSDGKVHSVPDIKLPRGVWFHYAAMYDGIKTKVFVDGKKVKDQLNPELEVMNSDRCIPLRLGEDSHGHVGVMANLDNIRLWDRAISFRKLRKHMYSDTNTDTEGLTVSWDMSDAMTDLSSSTLTSDDKSHRIAYVVPKTTVQMRNNIMTGPFVWKICPGATNAPVPKICSGSGRCMMHSKSVARCHCFPGYFGDDCSESCPGTGEPGGPCHVDYGWGKCEYNENTKSAQCVCEAGIKGEACQHPCPGRGADSYGKIIKSACSGRGECTAKEEVRLSSHAPLTEARKVSIRLLTTGIGKYKGAYDFKRLTGLSAPALNLTEDDVSNTNLTADGSIVPPANAKEFGLHLPSLTAPSMPSPSRMLFLNLLLDFTMRVSILVVCTCCCRTECELMPHTDDI